MSLSISAEGWQNIKGLKDIKADLKKVSVQSISDSTTQARDIFKLNERVKQLEEQLRELKLKMAP